MKQENTTCKGKGGKYLIIILLIVNIILSALAFRYAYINYNLEVLRGGGKENVEKISELYKSKVWIDYVTEAQQEQIDAFYGSSQPTPTATQNQTLDQQTIEALKQTGHLKGDKNADITILEFADANCSHCKRQIAQNKTINTIMDAYPNVNTIYKNMPVLGSFEQAQTIECFGATSSLEDYYTFVEDVYGATNTNLDNLLDIAESL
jgi:protein-disulfide isomerase